MPLNKATVATRIPQTSRSVSIWAYIARTMPHNAAGSAFDRKTNMGPWCEMLGACIRNVKDKS